MNLRTSCFNSAVFRSDVKRLWWVPALHTLSIFLLCLLPFYIDYHEAIGLFGGASEQYINSALFQCSPVPYIILGILTVGISVLLFSYLNSKSAVATMHAVPVKRKTLYITHIVFGLIALIVPILINGGILVIMRSNPNIAQVISMSHIGAWISTQIAYAVVGFAFSVLIGMFTGNSVAHLVFTYIFAVLPFLVEAGLKYIMYLNLYGYVMNDTNMAVAKYLYFSIDKLTEPTWFLLYMAYALVFFLIGYLIYKIRNLENSSEVVAFPKLKPIFVYGVSMCFGVAGYFYLAEIINVNNLFLALPFGLLGLVIANMLAKKSFTIKGILKPTVALVVSVSALFCLFHFDITGFEKRVPDAAKIESASVTRRPPDSRRFVSSMNGRMVVPKDVYVPKMTKQQDIEAVLKFHSHKTVEHTEESDNTDYLYVNYQLKDGKTMIRRYIVDYDDDRDFLKPIMETEENLKDRFPVLEKSTEDLTSISIADARLSRPFNSYFMQKDTDTEIANRLIDALKADLSQVTYEEFIDEIALPTYIEINYEIPLVYEGTDILVTDLDAQRTFSDTNTYYVRPSYKNTIVLLTELGFYDALPAASEYQSVEVWRTSITGDARKPDVVVTDPAQIEEIYNYVTTTQPKLKRNAYLETESGNAITLTFQSNTQQEFTVIRSKNDVGMPQSLAKLFE